MTDKARRLVHLCDLSADFRIAPSADVAELNPCCDQNCVTAIFALKFLKKRAAVSLVTAVCA